MLNNPRKKCIDFSKVIPITKNDLPITYAGLNSAMKEQKEINSELNSTRRFLESALIDLDENFKDVPEHYELVDLITNMVTDLPLYFEIVEKNKKLIRKAINKIPSDKRKQAQLAIRKETHGTHKCGGVCGRQIPAFTKVCSRSKCKASASAGKNNGNGKTKNNSKGKAKSNANAKKA